MADTKITGLSALGGAPAGTDLIPMVDDPSGTPATKKMTVDELFNYRPKIKIDATAAPDADDDSGEGYSVGSLWVDVDADKSYVCVDATSTAAVWIDTSLFTPALKTKLDGIESGATADWTHVDTDHTDDPVAMATGSWYHIDTSGGGGSNVYNYNLPASPNVGDRVRITVNGTASGDGLTIGRNGNDIQNAASDIVIGAASLLHNMTIALYYVSASEGWQVEYRRGDFFVIDTSDTLAADSDSRLPTQSAVKSYVDGLTAVSREFTKSQNFDEATLTDAATISWDLEDAQVAKVTLGGNRTLGAATNQKAGAFYCLRCIQDGTGTRTLAFNANYHFAGGSAPTLTTTANAVDILTFFSNGTNMILVGTALDVKAA